MIADCIKPAAASEHMHRADLGITCESPFSVLFLTMSELEQIKSQVDRPFLCPVHSMPSFGTSRYIPLGAIIHIIRAKP